MMLLKKFKMLNYLQEIAEEKTKKNKKINSKKKLILIMLNGSNMNIFTVILINHTFKTMNLKTCYKKQVLLTYNNIQKEIYL